MDEAQSQSTSQGRRVMAFSRLPHDAHFGLSILRFPIKGINMCTFHSIPFRADLVGMQIRSEHIIASQRPQSSARHSLHVRVPEYMS